MNKEIKEKLDYFRKFATIRENAMISEIENYITNLQEKYEEANYDRHKLFDEKQKLVKVIDELRKYCKEEIEEGNKMPAEYERYGLTDYIKGSVGTYKRILNKLTELKGGSE